MSAGLLQFLGKLKDPRQEVDIARNGIPIKFVEAFLTTNGLVLSDILSHLQISSSTYFARKKRQKILDTYSSEKFIRLFHVVINAGKIMGDEEARGWLYRHIPSLGNERPIDLLDTEPGFRLVEQTLAQVEHGVYG